MLRTGSVHAALLKCLTSRKYAGKCGNEEIPQKIVQNVINNQTTANTKVKAYSLANNLRSYFYIPVLQLARLL